MRVLPERQLAIEGVRACGGLVIAQLREACRSLGPRL
jgi:hypothetical protein